MELRDARDRNHEKTFRAWVNKYLRYSKREIDDNLMEGLQSGVNCILLAEMISGKAITSKYFKNPSLDIQRIENISIALAHLRKVRTGFVLDVEPKDVASGNVKVVLGLVWQLILRFQIMKEGEMLSSNPMQDAKDRVLKWWREMVGDVVPISGIDSFADGKAYFACVNKIMGFDTPFAHLSARDALTQSIALAEKHLGILPLLEVDDILADDVKQRPDERCVLTYLSEFPTAYELKLNNKTVTSAADDAIATLRAEHEAAERLAAAEAERLRAELARQSIALRSELTAAENDARAREAALARAQEEALTAARADAANKAKQEAAALAQWQLAAKQDADQALKRAERERQIAIAQEQAALRSAAENKEQALRRAEAEKQALAEMKANELARLRAEAAKRLRRQELERDQAAQEAAMKAQLSKEAFLAWRREREEELARLRSDRLALEQLAREELARLREENERLKRGNPHSFAKKTFGGPTWCHLCKSLCWPTAHVCARCRYILCAKCTRRNPPANCVASSEDDDENEDSSKMNADQLTALEQLPTLVNAPVQWRPTTLAREASTDSSATSTSDEEFDLNATGNTHGPWASRTALLKAGWLLLYDNTAKSGKLKGIVNMARASVLAFEAKDPKDEQREAFALVIRGRRAAHTLQFEDKERRATWWRVLKEQSAAAKGGAHSAVASLSLGDKVLIKLWRIDSASVGNVTLSLAADALPGEALREYARKARLDASAVNGLGVFERSAPTGGQAPSAGNDASDRALADTEPLHFLQGLRESAGKPIVFIVKKK